MRFSHMLVSRSDGDPPRRAGQRESLKGQLDLFAHSRTVVLLNDVIDSLLERNTARVSERLQLLRAEAPGLPALDALTTLRGTLERWPVAMAGTRDVGSVIEWLDCEVAGAAAVALGSSAPVFMHSLWLDLANAIAGQAYDPVHPRSHDAYCHLRAGDAAAALKALSRVQGHDLDPFILQCLTWARYLTSGWHACRAPLFTLALTAPGHLLATLTSLGDPALRADWERFWVDCAWLDPRDERAGAWFPAWYLIEHPATRIDEPVTAGDPDALPARAFQTMRRLLALEPGGYSSALIDARAELRHIDERLLRHYMSRRG